MFLHEFGRRPGSPDACLLPTPEHPHTNLRKHRHSVLPFRDVEQGAEKGALSVLLLNREDVFFPVFYVELNDLPVIFNDFPVEARRPIVVDLHLDCL